MANNITGNGDRDGGGNESYRIPGRGSHIPRAQLVSEVEAGKHPNHHVVTIEGEGFVRANPDSSESNNVNKD